jgi:hypothetical protein
MEARCQDSQCTNSFKKECTARIVSQYMLVLLLSCKAHICSPYMHIVGLCLRRWCAAVALRNVQLCALTGTSTAVTGSSSSSSSKQLQQQLISGVYSTESALQFIQQLLPAAAVSPVSHISLNSSVKVRCCYFFFGSITLHCCFVFSVSACLAIELCSLVFKLLH